LACRCAGGNGNRDAADRGIFQESRNAGLDNVRLPERLRSKIKRIFGRNERRHKRFQVRFDLGRQGRYRYADILA
jgi:hypothetical protein